MFRTIRLVAFFLCLTNLAHAEGLVDSLSRVLTRKDITPDNRITTMGLLARAKCLTDIEGAMRIENEALQLCRQANDPKLSTYIWSIMVMLQYHYGKHIPKCRQAADSALYYAQQSKDKLSLGIAWYRKAWVENLQAKLKDAVSSSFESLKYLEGTGNSGYTYISSVYYLMAGAHADWNNLAQQGKYARLSLDAAWRSGDFDNLLAAHQAMSTYYHYCYDTNKTNQALLDSTLWYNRQGISLYKAHADQVVIKSTLAVIALNMANLFQQYKMGNYKDSVAPYLRLALNTALETQQAAVIASSFAIMSEIEVENGNYEKAENLLLAGVAALPMDSINHQRNKVQLLDALYKLAEKRGEFAKALRYYKDYHNFYEALYDGDKVKVAQELEEKYESEKKEQAIQALNKQNLVNRKMKYLYASMALLAVIAGLYIFRSYNFRLKASQHQKKLLVQEKEDAALLARIKQQEVKHLELEKLEAELKARLKEEETLRLLAEQKLLQEREGRLQKDLLAVNLQIEQKDVLLQTVQKKIEESKDDRTAVKKINSIIDQNKKSDDAFASNKADFDTIRPEFFQQLKEKSADKLSRLDLKHCAYISLGLTNKEVAQRLGIAPKSILMARYRIKIKLGLSKDDDLDDFIAALSR